MKILREYIENDMKVIEYTNDGETVAAKVSYPTSTAPLSEPNSQPTIEQQLEKIRQDNLVIMDALATMYEELLGGV